MPSWVRLSTNLWGDRSFSPALSLPLGFLPVLAGLKVYLMGDNRETLLGVQAQSLTQRVGPCPRAPGASRTPVETWVS